MSKIVASVYMSLDGVIDHPEHWSFDYFDDEAGARSAALLDAAGALLMGRDTYAGFADAWPGRTGEFADRINALPKYVASTTLTDPTWHNTTVLDGDLAERARELKATTEGDIVMYGYGRVAHTLLAAGLLDEITVWLYPLLAGNQQIDQLIFRDGERYPLSLVGAEPMASGVVVLTYAPATSPDTAPAAATA